MQLLNKMLVLRRPTEQDLDFIAWLWQDLATTAILGGPFDFPVQDRPAWLAATNTNTRQYFLVLVNNEPVGEVSFRDFNPESGKAFLNIKIAAKYRGNGFAGQALELFLDFYYNDFGGSCLQDEVRKKNTAGIKLLEKFGFICIHETTETLFLEKKKDPDSM